MLKMHANRVSYKSGRFRPAGSILPAYLGLRRFLPERHKVSARAIAEGVYRVPPDRLMFDSMRTCTANRMYGPSRLLPGHSLKCFSNTTGRYLPTSHSKGE